MACPTQSVFSTTWQGLGPSPKKQTIIVTSLVLAILALLAASIVLGLGSHRLGLPLSMIEVITGSALLGLGALTLVTLGIISCKAYHTQRKSLLKRQLKKNLSKVSISTAIDQMATLLKKENLLPPEFPVHLDPRDDRTANLNSLAVLKLDIRKFVFPLEDRDRVLRFSAEDFQREKLLRISNPFKPEEIKQIIEALSKRKQTYPDRMSTRLLMDNETPTVDLGKLQLDDLRRDKLLKIMKASIQVALEIMRRLKKHVPFEDKGVEFELARSLTNQYLHFFLNFEPEIQELLKNTLDERLPLRSI